MIGLILAEIMVVSLISIGMAMQVFDEVLGLPEQGLVAARFPFGLIFVVIVITRSQETVVPGITISTCASTATIFLAATRAIKVIFVIRYIQGVKG